MMNDKTQILMMNRLAKTGILLLTAILMAACSGDNENVPELDQTQIGRMQIQLMLNPNVRDVRHLQ